MIVMLKHVKYENAGKDQEVFRKLYNRSFPDDERVPFKRLSKEFDESHVFLCWYEENEPAGITYTFHFNNMIYLGYLAVMEEKRDCGMGSSILQSLLSHYSDYVVSIDIEAGDGEEQVRRKQFYLRNGFTDTGIRCLFYNVDYELLGANGTFDEDDYLAMVKAHWPYASHWPAFYRD